jgi:hypothetical protein
MSGQHAQPKGAALTVRDLLARLVVEYREAFDAERHPHGRHAATTHVGLSPPPPQRPRTAA